MKEKGVGDLYDYEFILTLDSSLKTVVLDSEKSDCKN
jgi:hypothetical protein